MQITMENQANNSIKFADMNDVQQRLHNAALVLEKDGDEYGFVSLLREALTKITSDSPPDNKNQVIDEPELPYERYEELAVIARNEHIEYSVTIRGQQFTQWDDDIYHLANHCYIEGTKFSQSTAPANLSASPEEFNVDQFKKEVLETAAKACESNTMSWADTVWNNAVNDCAKQIRAMKSERGLNIQMIFAGADYPSNQIDMVTTDKSTGDANG